MKLVKEEIDLIVNDFFINKIKEVEHLKYLLEEIKLIFNVKYLGSNNFTVNANRYLDDYVLNELKERGFVIHKIHPRQNNEGPALMLELSYEKPKQKKG